jgi:type IV secretion system protein VirB9
MNTPRPFVAAAFTVVLLATGPTSAAGSKTDPRIRYVTFDNDKVTTVAVALGVSTMIEFQADEVIETISAGETKSWSIVPKKGSSILFVKPTEPNSSTNINVVTTRRVYALALSTIGGSPLYQIRFRYPDDDFAKAMAGRAGESVAHPDLKGLDPGTLNYDYVFKGAAELKPRVVFDNGSKTFMEFTGDVPSIFLVGAKGAESTVDSHMEGRFLVVDKVAAQFTLRAGTLATCLFNRHAGEVPPDDVEILYGPRPAETGSLGARSGGGR